MISVYDTVDTWQHDTDPTGPELIWLVYDTVDTWKHDTYPTGPELIWLVYDTVDTWQHDTYPTEPELIWLVCMILLIHDNITPILLDLSWYD